MIAKGGAGSPSTLKTHTEFALHKNISKGWTCVSRHSSKSDGGSY